MRAIAIQQPAASQISAGTKRIEFRTRRIAPGPLLVCADGAALCIVQVESVTGRVGAFRWHLVKPQRVRPFPTRSYGWITHVDDRLLRRVTPARRSFPYRFAVGDRAIRGEGATTPAAARARATELAVQRGVPIAILRDGLAIAIISP